MNRIIIYRIAALSMALLVCMTSSAQRTSRGQSYVDFAPSFSISGVPGLGVDVSYGTYLLSSRWDVGIGGMMGRTTSRFYPVYCQSSFMWRLCANRSRSLHLYAGGGILLGAEVCTPARLTDGTGLTEGSGGVDVDFGVRDEVAAADTEVHFIYGPQVRLESELFISRRTAVVLGLRMPLTIGSDRRVFHLNCCVGLRFNI